MNPKFYEKLLSDQEQASQCALESAMEHICDHLCRYPLANMSEDALNERCDMCLVPAKIRAAMERAEATGQVRALSRVSATCKTLTEEAV